MCIVQQMQTTAIAQITQGSSVGQRRGKFKNSLLHFDDFKNNVGEIFNDILNGSFDGGLWDTIKYRVKDYAIRYESKNKDY